MRGILRCAGHACQRPKCMRIIEISCSNVVRLFGPHAVWKDVGLLGRGCEHRAGRHEEDGCWPEFSSRPGPPQQFFHVRAR